MPTNPNMVAIQTVTVGSGGAANIEFTSIPQTYTDLVVKMTARTNTANNVQSMNVEFNGSGGTAYSSRTLYALNSGTPASTSASSDSKIQFAAYAAGDSVTASTFSNFEFYIPNYTSSNNKSVSADVVTENNSANNILLLTAGLWANSAAITSIKIIPNSGSLMQYSTATLYGVTSAGYGAKATGGIITEDANYYYHTFLASGTFTPTSNITADYLVVAGGGGGGSCNGSSLAAGGGGAGGYRTSIGGSGLSLTASTGYTVTIGGGGTGGGTNTRGTNGSNSVFSTVTSSGGGVGASRYDTGLENPDGGTGGSGGGGRGNNSSGGVTDGDGGAGNSGSYSPVEGYAGGNGNTTTREGGGGGGASEAGNTDGSMAGGDGSVFNGVTYAGGGGGGGWGSNGGSGNGGAGGEGGGGNGGNSQTAGSAATVNTGGGGGGAGGSSGASAGGAGGSGIVVVRYAK